MVVSEPCCHQESAMYSRTLVDLPTEVIRGFILSKLNDNDIRNFGKTGSNRLKEISDDYLRSNKCKFRVQNDRVNYLIQSACFKITFQPVFK